MSRTLSKYEKNKVLQNAGAALRPSVKTQSPPALREVNLPAAAENPGGMITAYKDLTQPDRDRRRLQNRHLLVGFVVFVVLGLGILMGRHFTSGSRNVATADMAKLIPAGAEESATSQHYHYDKTCYLGENGERICMTRTSQR